MLFQSIVASFLTNFVTNVLAEQVHREPELAPGPAGAGPLRERDQQRARRPGGRLPNPTLPIVKKRLHFEQRTTKNLEKREFFEPPPDRSSDR